MKETKETGLVLNANTFTGLNKEDLRTFSMAVVDKFSDGYESPTEGLVFAKKLADAAEMIKENLQDSCLNELKLGKGEKYSKFNVTINEQMTGVRYDFSMCGDLAWNRAKKLMTEREAFLKTVKGTAMTGDLETGETWMVNEPVKSGKLSPVIKVL